MFGCRAPAADGVEDPFAGVFEHVGDRSPEPLIIEREHPGRQVQPTDCRASMFDQDAGAGGSQFDVLDRQ